MPSWYAEAKEKMVAALTEPPPPMAEPPEMEKITDLPFIFAEYCIKEEDVLLHLFPRAGSDDQWVDGHYTNRCRSCRAEVPMPRSQRELRPCPRCGHSGLIYIPGRSEEASKLAFPGGVEDLIKKAVNTIWMGDAAVEVVPELGAYVVQFQRAKSTAELMGLEKFVCRVCEVLNDDLTPAN